MESYVIVVLVLKHLFLGVKFTGRKTTKISNTVHNFVQIPRAKVSGVKSVRSDLMEHALIYVILLSESRSYRYSLIRAVERYHKVVVI